MNKIKLTKTVVEKLPFAKKGKQIDYYDTELDGFGVRVSATGRKYFVRRHIGSKRIRVMIGSAAVKSTETARSEAKIKLGLMESGTDPNAQKREKIRKELESKLELTVKDLVTEYLEKHAKKEKLSWREDQRCLGKEVLPLWGKRKAVDIKKRDVVLLLDGIVDRGSPVMANNTLEKIRKMFNFAVEKDILEFTPCYGVKKPTKKEHKDRVLSDNEIAAGWNALDTAAMSAEIRRALKLILVTAQRPGEVIGIHSNEIEGDWWTIPAERAKNGKTHRVFLTATAKELIGDKEGFIFESPRGGKPMHVNAVAYAIRRNLEEPRQEEQEPTATTIKIVMESWTPHDLRRTAATNLSALGYSDEVIDAVLNHVKKGVIAIYNRHRYDKEKQGALEAWERKLNRVVTGKREGKVVSITTAKGKGKTAA